MKKVTRRKKQDRESRKEERKDNVKKNKKERIVRIEKNKDKEVKAKKDEKPVKTWLSKYTAFMTDRNRATVTICLHGMTTSQGGLECTLLNSMSEIQTPENIAVVKKFLNKKNYEAELGNVSKYKGGTLLGGLGQLAGTWAPDKKTEINARADVSNVVFAHINDPSNQDPERLSKTATTLAAR
uniref:Uncharacterized protein n=1 Tax=Romanomermis culicivorax TaxID=13658 RepID=A0A915K7T5_ROMCU